MSQETVDIVVSEHGSEQAAQNVEKFGNASEHADHQIEHLQHASEQLSTVLEALGLALTASKVIDYADSYTGVINKLAQVSHSSHELVEVEKELYEIAEATRMSFSGTADMYVSFSKATQGTNIEQKDLLSTIKTLNQAVQLQGKSGEEAEGAMRMFAFQLQQGEFSGRGLLMLLRQYPEVARAMAAGLNVSVSQLQSMGKNGELSASKVIDALKGIAPQVETQFNKMQVTISGAFHVIEDAVSHQTGQFMQSSGVARILAESMLFLAHHIEATMAVVSVLTTFLTVFTGVLLYTKVAAGGLFAVFAANPFALLLASIAVAITLFAKFGDQIELTSNGSVNALGLIVGATRSVMDGLSMLGHWLFQTDTGMQVLKGSVVAAATVLFFTFGTQAVGMVASGLRLLIPLVRTLSVSLITMIFNPVGASIAVFIGGAIAVAYYTGTLEKLKDKAIEIGQAIIKNISENVTKASADMKQSGIEGVDFSKQVGGAFNDIADNSSKMKKSLVDDHSAVAQSHTAMKDTIVKNHDWIRDAMGRAITETDAWKIRSGQAFNGVSDSVRSMGSTIDTTMAAASGAYTEWATAAEKAADRVIIADNKAAAAAREASKGPSSSGSGGGGGGGATGSFSFVNDVPGFLRQQAAMEAKEFADVKAAFEAANTQVGAAKEAALANANLMNVNAMSKWDDFRGGWGAGWEGRGMQNFANGGDFTVGGDSGITDSQIVSFKATRGEQVSVVNPNIGKRSGGDVHVYMTVNTPDVGGFKRSQTQTVQALVSKIRSAQQTLGGR